MNGSTPTPATNSVPAPTPLLKNPLAAGNKGITAAISTIALTVLSQVVQQYLPPWLQIDSAMAVPTIALSLQNLFARLRHRREAIKAALAASK